MRYTAIALLLCIPPAVAAQEASDCGFINLIPKFTQHQLDVPDSITPEAYYDFELILEEKLNHCSQEKLREHFKWLLFHSVFQSSRCTEQYNDAAKRYNSLLHDYNKLASDASELVKEVKVLREEKRALQMGQDLLLRLQRVSSRISSRPPPPRRLHCKSRTTGAIMPFGSFAGVTSTSNIECTEE